MPGIFDKLNLKAAHEIVALNAPASFESALAVLKNVKVSRSLADVGELAFAIAFVTTLADLQRLSTALTEKAVGDPVLWFAYPKKSSKNFACEFDRDNGWQVLGDAGFEGVRMVAIDADWSALRFRRVGYIKSFTRSRERALSAAGKNRTTRE